MLDGNDAVVLSASRTICVRDKDIAGLYANMNRYPLYANMNRYAGRT